MVAGTIQNVVAALPVSYKRIPPEGEKVIPIALQLGPSVLTYSTILNLQSLLVSQIVTAIIDNTQSDVEIICQFGVANTYVTVPPASGLIVPVFSNGPAFNILITAATIPAQTELINLTFLNFDKPSSDWGTLSANITNASLNIGGSVNANVTNAILNSQNTIINTGFNSSPLYSAVINPTGNSNTTLVAAPANNFILDSYDIACEAIVGTAAGLSTLTLALKCGGVAIHSSFVPLNVASNGQLINSSQYSATYRTWPQGLITASGAPLILAVGDWNNLNSAYIRINLSGYAT